MEPSKSPSHSDQSIKPLRKSSLTDPENIIYKSNVSCIQNAWSSIFESVSQSNLEETKGLLDNGHSPRTSNAVGDTPLHIASKSNSIEIVRILLDYGANPNSINAYGSTPLHVAARYGSLETVNLLLVYGADVNAVEFEVLFK